MKQKAHTFYRIILGALMGILGFSSCGKEGLNPFGGGESRCMYGQPSATFKLVGTVKDETGKPVKGIRVVYNPYADKDLNAKGNEYFKYNLDTLYTDDNGKFASDALKYNWPEIPAHELIVSDVDGATNGEYSDEKVPAAKIKSSHSKQGSNDWYKGTFTLSSDVVIKKK